MRNIPSIPADFAKLKPAVLIPTDDVIAALGFSEWLIAFWAILQFDPLRQSYPWNAAPDIHIMIEITTFLTVGFQTLRTPALGDDAWAITNLAGSSDGGKKIILCSHFFMLLSKFFPLFFAWFCKVFENAVVIGPHSSIASLPHQTCWKLFLIERMQHMVLSTGYAVSEMVAVGKKLVFFFIWTANQAKVIWCWREILC